MPAKIRARLTIKKSVYIITDISPNNLLTYLRNKHLRAIKTRNLKLFNPVSQYKTGFPVTGGRLLQ
jgi:hypothetical protein